MRVTNLSIGVEMRRSNGDYGSDKAEVQLTAALEPGEDPDWALRMMLGQARQAVESDLSRSPSINVRRAMITEYRTCSRCSERLPDDERSYMHKACREAEDAEREDRHQRMKAEQDERARAWAESNANAEEQDLVGVAVGDADDDEDEDAPL